MQYTARKCGGSRLVDNFTHTHIRTMTINEIKADKQALENAVKKLFIEFDEKHGASEVYLNEVTAKVEFSGGHNGIASAKMISCNATIEIPL